MSFDEHNFLFCKKKRSISMFILLEYDLLFFSSRSMRILLKPSYEYQ